MTHFGKTEVVGYLFLLVAAAAAVVVVGVVGVVGVVAVVVVAVGAGTQATPTPVHDD